MIENLFFLKNLIVYLYIMYRKKAEDFCKKKKELSYVKIKCRPKDDKRFISE